MSLARRVAAAERRFAARPCSACGGAGRVVVEYVNSPWRDKASSRGPCPRCGREQRITVAFVDRIAARRAEEAAR